MISSQTKCIPLQFIFISRDFWWDYTAWVASKQHPFWIGINTGTFQLLTNENLRVRELSSSRKSAKKTDPFPPLKISISIVQGVRGIGAHAFSPGTWDEALGHSYCCDFGLLLLKTILKRYSIPNSFSFKGRY